MRRRRNADHYSDGRVLFRFHVWRSGPMGSPRRQSWWHRFAPCWKKVKQGSGVGGETDAYLESVARAQPGG
ncbi:uncharacterized protein LOC144171000 isoform X5 [Haemaphysalis longicornis]